MQPGNFLWENSCYLCTLKPVKILDWTDESVDNYEPDIVWTDSVWPLGLWVQISGIGNIWALILTQTFS